MRNSVGKERRVIVASLPVLLNTKASRQEQEQEQEQDARDSLRGSSPTVREGVLVRTTCVSGWVTLKEQEQAARGGR